MENESNIKINLTQNPDSNKKHRLLCASCRRKTNHTTQQSLRRGWETDDSHIAGYDDFLIVKCDGCETVQFCQISSCSEYYYSAENPQTGEMETYYSEKIDQYPAVNTSYEKPSTFHSMPSEIKDACAETYSALCGDLPKLGAAGTRLIIETLCLVNNIGNGNLKQKINALAKKGVITGSMRTMLHKVRLFGNDKLHTTATPKKVDLEQAWSAVCNLLRSVYGTKDTTAYFKAFSQDKVKPKADK